MWDSNPEPCEVHSSTLPLHYIALTPTHPYAVTSLASVYSTHVAIENMSSGFILNEVYGKRAFDALKPVCVRVMSSPSLESLAELRGKVSGLPVAIHPHLVDYVLLPVRVLFKRCGR